MPRGSSRPPLFLLGSSLASARLAATRGDAFAFAGHFSPALAVPALRTYRERFTPGTLQRPHAILAVAALAAGADEHAQWLFGGTRLAALHPARGIAGPLVSPESAARHRWTAQDHAIADSILTGHVVGDQDHVRAALLELATHTGADELMITANTHGFDDHVRNLQLLAEALGVRPAATGSHASAAVATLARP